MLAERHDGVADDVRLAALAAYDVLDTRPERGFDDVVTLATQICDTPVALVSLVDRNRQWFKARVGFEPCETDLDRSVCRHALGRTDILEIADLTLDSRTQDNPLVTGEPHIRFYAGAPLNTADGRTLGTLCVIDHIPRPGGLTSAQRVGLVALANQVVSQLDLRRALIERRAGQDVALAEAQRLEAMIATQQAAAVAKADLGAVFQAIVDGALRVVDAAEGAVIELREGDDLVYDTVSGSSARHKGVRLPIVSTLSGLAVTKERPLYCADTQSDRQVDHAQARDLDIRSMVVVPVTRRGEPIGALKVQSAKPDAFSPRDVVMTQMLAGLVASSFGDVAEVKSRQALRAAESRYRQTFESATEFAVVVTDRSGTVMEWNTGAERIFGWTADEMRCNDISRIFTPEDRAAGRPKVEMRLSIEEGQSSDERWHLRKDRTRFYASGNMMPLRGDDDEHLGFLKIVRDRTAQRLAEASVEASERRYRTLYDAIDEGFCILEMRFDDAGAPADYRFLDVNPAFERQTGLYDAVGKWMRDLAPEHEAHWFEIYGRVASGGKPERFEQHAKALGNRWYEVYAYPVGEPGSHQLAVLFNDVSERKRAAEAVAASEAKWRGLFEDLQEGFILGRVIRDDSDRVADWRYEEVNLAWYELTGVAPGTALGRTIRELFPGIEDEWVNEFAAVVDTGETIRFTRQVGTLGRWYDGVCQPVGDDRFTVIFIEVTDRVHGDRRREALRELSDTLVAVKEPDAMFQAASELIGRALGVGRVGYGSVADDGETFTVPTDWTKKGFPSLAGVYRMDDYGLYADDLRRGRTVVISDIRLDPRTSGDTEPLESVAVRTLINHPVVENGRTVAILYVNDDQPRAWTKDEVAFLEDAADRVRAAGERRRAEAALRASDDRYRALVENVDVGMCIIQLEFDGDGRAVDYRIVEGNAAYERHTGLYGSVGKWVSEIAPGLERHWFDLYGGVALTGEPARFQNGAVPLGGRWFDVQAYRVGDPADRQVAILFADITARRQAEERRVVLNRELSHRLKNTLAIVQSIATQTLRSAPDMLTARRTLTERVGALSKAHDILLVGTHDAAPIAEVVRSATALHDGGSRIKASGPDVRLGPKAALTLALILHELSTNAGKYGALSVDTGGVDVGWSVTTDQESGRPDLRFEWREFGGPPVTPPTRTSFGTRLIEMGLSGTTTGSSAIEYAPGGVVCRITASLNELQTDGEAEVDV